MKEGLKMNALWWGSRREKARQAEKELRAQAHRSEGDILVVGCSSS